MTLKNNKTIISQALNMSGGGVRKWRFGDWAYEDSNAVSFFMPIKFNRNNSAARMNAAAAAELTGQRNYTYSTKLTLNGKIEAGPSPSFLRSGSRYLRVGNLILASMKERGEE